MKRRRRSQSQTGGHRTDLSHWLTKQQAADAIGVSTKAIERFTQAKKLEQRFRPRAGSPHVAVYDPDDVARIAHERHPAPPPFVLPAVPPGNRQARRAAAPSTELAIAAAV